MACAGLVEIHVIPEDMWSFRDIAELCSVREIAPNSMFLLYIFMK